MESQVFKSNGRRIQGSLCQSGPLRTTTKKLSFTPKPSNEVKLFSFNNDLEKAEELKDNDELKCPIRRRPHVVSCKEIEGRKKISKFSSSLVFADWNKTNKKDKSLNDSTDNLAVNKLVLEDCNISFKSSGRLRANSTIDDLSSISESDIQKLTNSEEEISNFYTYTEDCFKTLLDFKEPTQEVIDSCSVTLPFTVNSKKRLAVFDLDETLVHCEIKNKSEAQHIIEVPVPFKGNISIGLNIRPHWTEALDEIKKKYHIVIYTASHHSYGDAVLNYIDPNKDYFEYRLYRNNCIQIKEDENTYYIKDLRVFKNVDLKDIVIIDNSVLSFAFQINNGLPIMPYYSGDRDYELVFLACYLKSISSSFDLRKENIKFLKLDILLEEAKHSEENIEEEDNDSKDLSFTLSVDEIDGNTTYSSRTKEERLFTLEQVVTDLRNQMLEGNIIKI